MTMHAISVSTDNSVQCPEPPGRVHGTLGVIADSERRTLRPIGTTAREVAERTGALLAHLAADPAVWIFQGVRPCGHAGPPISHVISVGREVMLIESVAWPPGRYAALDSGDIHCGEQYIGQSTGHLTSALRYWRQLLPADHRASAMVVVHPTTTGELVLPTVCDQPIAWAHAHSALAEMRARLGGCGHERAASKTAIAALFQALADPA
jgi:hypothetical protein